MNAAVVGTAIIASIDVLLKANMSRVRVMSMKKAASVAGIAAAKAEIASRLKWWHVLNLNHAEYTPIFASLMLYLGLRQSLLSKPLTRGQSLACWCTTLSSILFVVGYLVMGSSARQPHPLRAIGALGRYVSYVILIIQALRA